MNAEELKKNLAELDACEGARKFCIGKTLAEAWETCPRGDWMLWLYSRLYPDNKRELSFAKGYCAATVKHLMKDPRSIKAVEAAIAYGEGKITDEELRAADAAAYAAYAAAAYAADAAAAAYADAAAAYAAAAAAAYAAAASQARLDNQMQTADICRKYLKLEIPG